MTPPPRPRAQRFASLVLALIASSAASLRANDDARDSTPTEGAAPDVLPPNAGIDGGLGGHWGVRDDRDWVDGRWSRTDLGPFLSSSLDTPAGLVVRAVSVRLGESRDAGVAFDTVDCTWKAAWDGGFLALDPARFGLIGRPKIAGTVRIHPGAGARWRGAHTEYRGLRVHGERVLFSYALGETDVLDLAGIQPLASSSSDAPPPPIFLRTIELSKRDAPLELPFVEIERVEDERIELQNERATFRSASETKSTLVMLEAPRSVATLERRGTSLVLRVLAGDSPAVLRLRMWSGPTASLAGAIEAAAGTPLESPSALSSPGPRRWDPPLVTHGHRAPDDAPWVIDTAPLPFENPWNALLFLSGIDFFRDGRAAVSAAHGDVWIVDGLDGDLDRVTWKRFATGLYQPLGLRIVDGDVYVLGRDRITRLHDEDHDGEADLYESFSDAIETSAGGHDYVTSLEVDQDGNFYWADPKGVHRVSRDGGDRVTLATGFRNPNGLSVSADGGIVTVAPQEGEWTPASMICEIRPGGYYGYGGPRVAGDRPLGYDPPLLYLPRHVDNSTGSQLWVESTRWGPLEGALLSFSFGRSSIGLILRDVIDGQAQGAIVPLPGRFLSGAMRGRFSPTDGQLWVVGMNGWVTNAIADGSLQRVRHTGRPVALPISIESHANGIVLRFTAPLDPRSALDPGSWSLERWQYRYSADYGSAEWSIAHPDRVGHDPVEVAAAHLFEEGRAVLLEIPAFAPAMQLGVRATLETVDGDDASFELYATIHRLRSPLDAGSLGAISTPDDLVDDEDEIGTHGRSHGDPGAILALEARSDARRSSSPMRDVRKARALALHVPRGSAPSAFVDPGPFRAQWRGRLVISERDRIRFSARGRGRVRMILDGKLVLDGEIDDRTSLRTEAIPCDRGARPFELWYESPESGDATLAIRWQGRRFPDEPIPPEAIRHDPNDSELLTRETLHEGRKLVLELQCLRCHAPGDAPSAETHPRKDSHRAPTLSGIGRRRPKEWIARYILDPSEARPHARMPRLIRVAPGEDDSVRFQRARDIAGYLVSHGPSADDARVDVAAPADGAIAEGQRLFATLGCFACHPLPLSATINALDGARGIAADDDRIALDDAGSAWVPTALCEYLIAPSRHHPSTRMPTFPLSDGEAASLAAFLISTSSESKPRSDGPRSQDADVERGAELYRTSGCVRCHGTIENGEHGEAHVTDSSRAPSFASIVEALRNDDHDLGCLAERPTSRAPDFSLATGQRLAIAELLRREPQSLFRRNAIESAERAMRDLRCGACHDRDGIQSRWSLHESEVAHLLPPVDPGSDLLQTRPTLTFAGEKLHAAWLAALLEGKLTASVRPWLRARMPRFPGHGDTIARGLAYSHGRAFTSASRQDPPAELARIGETLLGERGGLSCVTCHSIGDEPARMRLHFGVIDLEHARARLHDDFYLRWMLAPQRIDPSSPMPAFADESGRTALTDIFAGDARRQFEAIWAALANASKKREEFTAEDAEETEKKREERTAEDAEDAEDGEKKRY